MENKVPPIIQVQVLNAQGQLRHSFSAQQTGAVLKAQPNTSFSVILSEQTGGTKAVGGNKTAAPQIKFKRTGSDLVIQDDADGQTLLTIEGYYDQTQPTLDSVVWRNEDGKLYAALSPESVAKAGLVGNGSSESEIAVLFDRAESKTSGSLFSWVTGGGLAGVAAFSGGSGSAAAATTTGDNLLNSTLIKGMISAGPVVLTNDLKINLYDKNGNLLAKDVAVKSDGSFETTLSVKVETIIAVVRNTGSNADYIDETTGVAKNMDVVLTGIGNAQTVNNITMVKLQINPVTTLAAKQIVDLSAIIDANGNHISGGKLATTLNTEQVNQGNNLVANLFGLGDIMGSDPVLVVAASQDGKTAVSNSGNYNEVDGVTAQERYGQVLAMLSGLDQYNIKNGGTAADTLAKLTQLINDNKAAGNVGTKAAIDAITTQLVLGATQFEFMNNSSAQTGGVNTADFANLLTAAAGDKVNTAGNLTAGTDTSQISVADKATNALLIDAFKNYPTVAAFGGKSAENLIRLTNISNAIQNLATLKDGDDPNPATNTASPLTAEEYALLFGPEGAANLSLMGISGVTTSNLKAVLWGIQHSAGGTETDTVLKLNDLVTQAQKHLDTIGNYADNNGGTAPDASDYIAAGISGMSSVAGVDTSVDMVAAVNSALASTSVTKTTVSAASALQTIVNSFNNILKAADNGTTGGSPGDGSIEPAVLSEKDFTSVGVDLGSTSASSSTFALIQDIIGHQTDGAVDTTAEIQKLVDIAKAVQSLAALDPGTAIPNATAALLTPENLALIGMKGVTTGNLNGVLEAVQRQDNSGALTDSLTKLNTLVSAVDSASGVLTAYAIDPQATNPPPATPTVTDYLNAGVKNVTATNLAAINSALADADVHPTDAAGVQAVVDAYNKILGAADSAGNTGTDPSTLTTTDFTAIGINLDTSPTSPTSAANDPQTLALLQDIIGNKDSTGVDTVAEVQKLADIANAIQALAALDLGKAIPQWITDLLTPTNLTLAGIQNVNAGNLSGVLTSIQTAANDGSATNSLSELNDLVNQVNAAGDIIASFADNNASSEPLPTDSAYGSFAYIEGSTVLTEAQFIATGVKGVTASNVGSIKDALATASITSSSINTTAKLQNIVDAFIAIRDAADGTTTTSIPSLSQSQYAATGISSSLAGSLLDAENLQLMNDIIGGKQLSDVDTVAEISNLARIVKGIQDTAAGLPVSPALTAVDLSTVGITGVTAGNLASVLSQIATAKDDGSQTSKLADLQSWINQVNYAPVNTVSAPQSVNEDTGPHYLNGLAVSDGDIGNGQITVVLSAPNGKLSVANNQGSTVTTDDANHKVTLVGSLAQINAALATNNNIAWTPAVGYYGTASISMATTDTAAAGTSDGNKTDTDTITITVASVSDAPTGTDKTITLNEDGSYSFSASDFGYTDNEGVMPANAFVKVKITTLPLAGTLKLNGINVSAGDMVDVAQLGNLVFSPAANANGTASANSAAYASFTFQVMDNGDTANGGSDTDATPRTLTFNVNPVAEIVANGVVIDSAVGAQGGYLNAGDNVTVMVTFDQAVTVSGSGANSPSIDLDIGGTLVKAYYDAAKSTLGSGKVAFTYTVLNNQLDADGIAIPANGIKLNGGSILSDSAGSVPAVLDHALVADNNQYKVDAVNPLLSSISATLTHDAANDTGTSATDNLTQNTHPTLTGTVEAGASVRVTVGGKTYDSKVGSADYSSAIRVDTSGNWTLIVPLADALSDSSTPSGTSANSGTVYNVDVTATDAAGNPTTKTTAMSFTLDTKAADAASVTGALKIDAANDTGVSADNRTKNTLPTLSGVAEKGASVEVTIGSAVYTTTADAASGAWSITLTSALTDSASGTGGTSFTPSIKVTDKAGNVTSAINGTSFSLDTHATPDNLITGGLPNGSGGYLATTSKTTPTLSGTAEAGAGVVVSVLLGSNNYRSDVSGSGLTLDTSNGQWSLTVPATYSLTPGSYTPQITVTDAAGNVSNTVSGTSFVVSVTLNGALDTTSDTAGTGYVNGAVGNTNDYLTKITTPKLTGQAPANNEVEVTLNGYTYKSTAGEITVNYTTGEWSMTVPAGKALVAEQTYTWSIKAIDKNNPSNVINANGSAFTLDSTAPSVAPADLTGGLDTTVDSNIKGDNITNGNGQTNVLLSGTAEPGAAVSVLFNGSTYTGVTNTLGKWSITGPAFSTLNSGTSYDVQVTLTDAAGNVSTPTTTTSFTYDNTAPTFSSVTVDGLAADGTTAKHSLLQAGDVVIVTATALEKVTVTGKPTYALTLTSAAGTTNGSVNAVYDADASLAADATGKTLVFKYTVKTNDVDADGLSATTGAIALGTGITIKDDAGINANTSAALTANATLTIDAKVPTVTAIAIESDPGTDKTYVDGDKITLSATFSEAVTFSDNNVGLNFRIGSTTVTAMYDSANAGNTGSKKFFSYTVSAATNDTDSNGIAVGTNPLGITGASTTIRDAAGNDAVLTYSTVTLAEASNTHMVDTTAPAVTISRAGNYTITQTNATATNNSDTITFTFSENPGTSFALTDVVVKDGNGNALLAGTDFTWGTLSALTQSGNNWIATATFTPKTSWAYTGDITFNVPAGNVQDLAGNNSTISNTLTVAIDNQLPTAPTISLSVDSSSALNSAGTSSDKISNVTTLTTTSAELGGTVQYMLEKMVSGSYVDQSIGGGWGSLIDYNTYMDSAVDAQYRVTTRLIDKNGNVGTASTTPLVFTRDTAVTGTATTTFTLDSGNSSLDTAYTSDKLSKNAQLEITGFESGAIVQYRVGSGAWLTATLSSGKYVVSDADIAGANNTTDNGKTYTISLRQIDQAGNVRDETAVDLVRDVVAPNVSTTNPNALSAKLNVDNASDTTPMDNLVASNNDSGVKGDNITANNTPTLSGTGESGAWVTVTLKNTANPSGGTTGLATDVVLNAVQIQADGTWSVTVPNAMALADGVWSPTLKVEDAAGNYNTATTVSNTGLLPLTIDTTAPQLTISATRVGGAGGVFNLGSDTLYKGQTLLITFAFDDDIISDSFTESDLTITGGVLSGFARMATPPSGFKAAWTAIYAPTDGANSSTGSVTLAASSLQNVAATVFGNSAVSRSINYDTKAPDIVSIKRDVSVPTGSDVLAAYKSDSYLNKLETNDNTDAATFLVKFTESVFGLTAANFALKDLLGNTINGVSYTVSGSGTDWTVTATNLSVLSDNSSVRLELINRNGITDASVGGNDLVSPTFSNGEVYAVDKTAPGLASLTSSTTVGSGTPLLSGRAEAGGTVTVTAGGATFTASVNDFGVWTIDTSSSSGRTGTYTNMSGASNSVTVTPTDAAGNTGTVSSYTLSVVAGTPFISTIGITNDSTPTVQGSTTANAWVRISIGGAIYDVQANASGSWSVDTGAVTPNKGSFNEVLNGNYTITAQTVSGSGGTTSGGTATATLTIDTIAPTAPTITSSPYTTDSTPTITGTADAGAKVRVSLNGSSYDVMADATGQWSLNIDNVVTSGSPSTTVPVRVAGTGTALTNSQPTGTSYALTARQIDAAGNLSNVTNQTLVFDNQAPADPTIDTGTVLTSSSTAPLVSGTGEAGAQITLVIGGATYQTMVGTNGRWSVATATETPVSGAYVAPSTGNSVTAYVRQTDAAGNVNTGSTDTTTTNWTIHQTYSYNNSYPAITSADLTNDTTPIISGTGPLGTSVDVVVNGFTFRANVGPDGKWSINTETATIVSPAGTLFTALSNGNTYNVTANITGNSANVATQHLIVDTAPPSPLTINTVAGDDFISQSEKGTVTITGTVEIGASVSLNVAGNLRNATVKADGTWSYQLIAADYTAMGESGSTGDQSIIATAKDKAGNQLIRTRNFTIDTVAPVVDLDRASVGNNYSLALSAKNVALKLNNDTTAGVTDAVVTDVGMIAAVKIGFQRVQANGTVVGFVPQDGASEQMLIGDQVLSLNGSSLPTQLNYGGLVWYIDYAAGVFTLTPNSGVSTTTAQNMLRNIRYMDKDPSSTADDDNRVFSFQLVDQAGNTGVAATTTLVADSVPPALDLDSNNSSGVTGTGFKATVTGSTIVRVADTDLVVNEAGNGNNKIASIAISVAGLQDGTNEKLLVNTASGTLATGWAANGSAFTNGSTFTLGSKTWAVNYTSATSTFTFKLSDGSKATDAEAQSLIDALRYQNAAGSATDGARSFKFVLTDGVGNAMTTAAESVISYNASLPAANPVGTAVFTAATTNTLAQNSNGQITLIDANGDGTLGDQFVLRFTESVATAALTNVSNWTLTAADPVVNGTFATNMTGWTSSGTVAYNSGSGGRVIFNSGTNTVGNYIEQTISTVTGVTYTLSYSLATSAAAAMGLRVDVFDTLGTGTNIIATQTQSTSSTTTTTYSLTFTATGSNMKLRFTDTVAAASTDLFLDNVTVSAPTPLLGTGATIRAVNPITINGVEYARDFSFTAGSGATYTQGATLTVAAANVVDSTGGQATTSQTFTLGDIRAPDAPTPPLNINQNAATSVNFINAAERAATTSIIVSHNAAEVGGKLYLLVNGVEQTTKTVTFTSAGATSTTFTLSGNDWGNSDGIYQLSFKQMDGAGNVSLASALKTVTVDTAIGTLTSMAVVTDANGVPDAGDVVQLRFSEAVSLTAGNLPAGVFGTSPTVTGMGAVSGRSSVWNVTLGASPTLSSGQSLKFSNLNDEAGNSGNVTAQVPANLYTTPRSISIANVTAGALNVVESPTERANAVVTVNLTGAATGDVVKLYMDGVEIGSRTLLASDLSSYSFSGINWGADGTRNLTASIKRGSGTVVQADARPVYVSADQAHWSTVNGTIWFDPDAITAAVGSSVASWSDSSGRGINAVQATTANQPTVIRSALGGKAIYVNGSQTLSFYDTNTAGNANGLLPNTADSITLMSTMRATLQSGVSFPFAWCVTDTSNNTSGTAPGGGSYVGNGWGLGAFLQNALTWDNIGGLAGDLLPPNTMSYGQWMAATGQVFNNAGLSFRTEIYANSQLLQSSTNTGAIKLETPLAIIGGSLYASIVAELGDQIILASYLGNAARMEIETYQGAKYAAGAAVALNGSNTYDLSSSNNTKTLIDDRLVINTQQSNDTVTTMGSDYVNTGAGNDSVTVKDLYFRYIDGGLGFDIFRLDSTYATSSFLLSDYVSNARADSGVSANDTRVNANGYHKLMGFEVLDFSQATEKQTVQLAYADIDQLAEKGLAQGTNVTVNNSTSNLFMVLDSKDWLDVNTSGLGNASYGFWQDANGVVYDRKFSGTVGTDTATLYVRGGDDAPDFGATSTAAVVSATSVAVDLSEVLGNFSGTSAQWTIASANSSISSWSTATTQGKTTLTLTGSFDQTSYLDISYTGSAIIDSNGDPLRYKGLAIGLATADNINLSGKSAATNSAYGAGYAIFGNDGKDVIVGTNWDDLIVGGASNDTLTGGLGADTFRTIQYEGGIDTVTDFNKSQGDKIDLRGILKGSAVDASAVAWNADGTISAASLASLINYVSLGTSGSTTVVKVDDSGAAGFATPAYQMQLQNANVAGNLGALDLQTLINQKVILV